MSETELYFTFMTSARFCSSKNSDKSCYLLAVSGAMQQTSNVFLWRNREPHRSCFVFWECYYRKDKLKPSIPLHHHSKNLFLISKFRKLVSYYCCFESAILKAFFCPFLFQIEAITVFLFLYLIVVNGL